MFRRITDRLTNATIGDGLNEKVRTLQSLGFDANQARNALEQSEGDVDRAAELLFASNAGSAANPINLEAQDTALNNALQESMQSEEQRRYQQAQEASLRPPPTRSAAVNHAALAAAKRAQDGSKFGNNHIPATKTTTRSHSGGLSTHHPQVKLVPKFEHKTKEEQLIRCADRLKPYPSAVDTLHRALTMIRNNPRVDKYRKIDKTTAGYKRSLENVPGAEQLLLAMNFTPRGSNTLIMDQSQVDSALLYLGISALETAKQSPEYLEAKRKIAFNKEFQDIQAASDVDAQEAIKRAEFMSKCPSEPKAGALVQIVIGSDTTVKRRFDGDDILQDVVNFLGAHGSQIPNKLMNCEWCLVDLNRYPIAPIDVERNLDKTLQFVGFWPSGKLEVRPSPEEWFEGKQTTDVMGSSRGLGAAPTEALH